MVKLGKSFVEVEQLFMIIFYDIIQVPAMKLERNSEVKNGQDLEWNIFPRVGGIYLLNWFVGLMAGKSQRPFRSVISFSIASKYSQYRMHSADPKWEHFGFGVSYDRFELQRLSLFTLVLQYLIISELRMNWSIWK